jgi:hypothetical protein
MSTLDISEYVDTSHGNLIEPPIAHQTVELGDEPASSKPLHKLTRCLRIVSDVDCLISVAVGDSKPTQFLRAGVAETRIVQPDTGFILSALAAEPNRLSAGPGGLWSFGDLSHALALIAEPAKAKQRLDAIAQAMAEAQALIAQACRQVATSAATTKADQEQRRKEAAEHAAVLAADRQAFDLACQQREVALTAREVRVSQQESKLEADREELHALHEDLSSRAAAFEAATRPLHASRKRVMPVGPYPTTATS